MDVIDRIVSHVVNTAVVQVARNLGHPGDVHALVAMLVENIAGPGLIHIIGDLVADLEVDLILEAIQDLVVWTVIGDMIAEHIVVVVGITMTVVHITNHVSITQEDAVEVVIMEVQAIIEIIGNIVEGVGHIVPDHVVEMVVQDTIDTEMIVENDVAIRVVVHSVKRDHVVQMRNLETGLTMRDLEILMIVKRRLRKIQINKKIVVGQSLAPRRLEQITV